MPIPSATSWTRCFAKPLTARRPPARPQTTPRLRRLLRSRSRRRLTASRRPRASSRTRSSPVSLQSPTGNTSVNSWRRKLACRKAEAEQRVTETFTRLDAESRAGRRQGEAGRRRRAQGVRGSGVVARRVVVRGRIHCEPSRRLSAAGCGTHRCSPIPDPEAIMRSILLWLLGVPIPIIILIALLT